MTPPPAADVAFGFEQPEHSSGFLLWQVTNRWQREIRRALEPLGLTHTQFVVLASAGWLGREGRGVTQAQVADHAQLDAMNTSNVVRTLEAKGLLERRAHATDTRAKSLNLSDAGRRQLQQAVHAVEAFDRAFFGALPAPPAFNAALQRLLGRGEAG